MHEFWDNARVLLTLSDSVSRGRSDGVQSARRRNRFDPQLVSHGSEGAAGRARHGSVRQPGVQRRSPADTSPQTDLSRAAPHHDARRAARQLGRRRRRVRDEGVGGGARRDALHALVPAAHRDHGGKARLLSLADQRRQGGAGVFGQGAGPRRARRVEFSVRRHAQHLRSTRLHGVGSDQPAVAAQERQRDHAGDPDRVRELDR